MDEDINLLNWSINQNNEKDMIYDKIKSLITIIIVILCLVAFISLIYFALPAKYMNRLQNQTDIFENLLKPKPTKLSKNEANIFNNIFS